MIQEEEEEMTLNQLIFELYQVLMKVKEFLGINIDYGDFHKKTVFFKVNICVHILSTIATTKREECFLPHLALGKLIASYFIIE